MNQASNQTKLITKTQKGKHQSDGSVKRIFSRVSQDPETKNVHLQKRKRKTIRSEDFLTSKKTGLPKFGNAAAILSTNYAPKKQIVENLIIEGLTFFAGAAKLGKTTLMVQMLRPICNEYGGEIFGRKVQHGNALFISLEESKASIQNKMRAQGWTIDEASYFTIMSFAQFMDNIGPLHTEGAITKLLIYILEGQFSIVIVDSFKRAFLGLKYQDDSNTVAEALNPIHQASNKAHFAFVFIDHHGHAKGPLGMRTRDPVDAIMNSSSKGQVADTVMGFFEEGKNRLVTSRGRDITTQEFKLSFDESTLSSQRVEANLEDDMTGRQAIIYRWLRSNQPARLIQVEKGTGISSSNIQPILKQMVKAGLLDYDVNKKTYMVCKKMA